MLHITSREQNMTVLSKGSMNGRLKAFMQKFKIRREYHRGQ